MPFDLSQAQYLISAHHPKQWPSDVGIEVAFAGRSNVGKSSAINVIANRRGLARTSKTPGRTQQLVFFELDGYRRLVDLPGYGYAKVPTELKRHWEVTVEQYLSSRQCLRGLVIPMDARRPLMPLDRQLLAWCVQAAMAAHILLTKADKLSKGARANALRDVRNRIGDAGTVQLFSATTRDGLDEARDVLYEWLKAS
ncbi:MAG: ribosome biogenesis GTP-binding protein YihA/YsxC [Gammaproteobacteria bacterium]|nr:ribosome biogenesis GTP-binding protein YihA/YsxC [Gammaproteobacteria bacterium]MDH3466736.1 ribosome biogenesis GTP-binding protein YihA/YsxC [Gammaproteobacteria bacterium]